jgi:predicted O-linked N-acetylglucosamine transferase (SPINDLY family)/GT2 family glycosyltransferase
MPRVSVVIESYNHEQYVAEAIQSVLDQTYQDFEIIITDDGSSDRTVEVIKSFDDPRIKLFSFAENQGACIAAKHGIGKAQGEFIARLSSDDVCDPNRLKKQVDFIDANPSISAVFSYAEIIDKNSQELIGDHPYKSVFIQENRTRFEWLRHFFFKGNCLCHPSLLIKRQCYQEIGTYDPRFRQLPDFDFWIRLCINHEIHIIEENLIRFRIHSNESNASSNTIDNSARLYMENVQILKKNYLDPAISENFYEIFSPHDEYFFGEIYEELLPFYIAMVSLDSSDIFHRAFTVDTLYKILDEEKNASKIERLYNFRYNDLFKIVVDCDTFHTSKVAKLNSEIWQKHANIKVLEEQIDQLQYTLEDNLQVFASGVESFQYKPTFSIIFPVFNTPEKYLIDAIESVINQIYPYWELCIADDASTKTYVKEILQEYSRTDARIKVVYRNENGHISRTSNSAIEIATGEYIALFDHDDLLTSDALYEMALLINQHPEADMIYSDEDKVNDHNQFIFPTYKPGWCPDSFLSRMYTCHLGVYRRSIVNKIGGFRVGYEGSQDYDLVLRFTEKTKNIFHIPKILYHWRLHAGSTSASTSAKTYAYEAGFNALQDALDRRNEKGIILSDQNIPGHYHARYPISNSKLVSIIILAKEWNSSLNNCLESIFSETIYPQYEIILISNKSTGEAESLQDKLINKWCKEKPEQFKRYNYEVPFNYSKFNNYGSIKAQGEYLCFLSSYIQITQPDWLDLMIEQSQRESIGAVGSFLLDSNDTIHHAGLVLGLGKVAGNIYQGLSRIDEYETLANIKLIKNVSCVTDDCLVCRKDVFKSVGGFEESLIAYRDVDLCLKMVEQGYSNIYLPHVSLRYQNLDSPINALQEEYSSSSTSDKFILSKWEDFVDRDPCCSPRIVSTINLKASRIRLVENQALKLDNADNEHILSELKNKLDLRAINLVIFPNWLEPENDFSQELSNIIKHISLNHSISDICLLINNSSISEDDANLLLSSIFMNLIIEKEIEISENLQIYFINAFAKNEWDYVAPLIKGIINLSHEDVPTLVSNRIELLPVLLVDDLDTIDFTALSSTTSVYSDKESIDMTCPLVSICIPTYNGQDYIYETINSAFLQTYPNLEIILSDDNSSDQTVEIVKSIQSPCKLSILEHKQYGLAENWNYCISQAQGKYIKFLFQDDILQPNAITELVNRAEQDQSIGLVFSPRKLFTSNNNHLDNRLLSSHEANNIHTTWSNLKPIQSGTELLQDLNIFENPINKIGEPSTVLIKKEVFNTVGLFNPELCQLVDIEMWLRIMSKYKVGFVNQVLSSFRIHSQQQTQKNSSSREIILLDYQKFFRIISTDKHYPESTRQAALLKYELISTPDNNLQVSRKQLANLWLNLTNDQLADCYQGLSGKTHNLLINNRIGLADITNEDKQFASSLISYLENGAEQPHAIQYFMAVMLYYRADQLPLNCDLVNIPNWLLTNYIYYLFSPSINFQFSGEADHYHQYLEAWMNYLYNSIFDNPDDLFWREVANIFSKTANFIPVYFNDQNLKDLYVQRAKIIEFSLDTNGYKIDHDIELTLTSNKKIRLGIIAAHYTPSAETFATLPIYEYLSREFEVTLYTLNSSSHPLEKYCRSCANHSKLLPAKLSEQVDFIRQDDLDILFFATNVTAVTNPITLLATHRLARIQVTSGASVVTTGMRNMDYFVSGSLTDISPIAQEQYSEKLIQLPGAAHCFSYGNHEDIATITIDRETLGIHENSVVFTSAANFFKIIPELLHTWAKIVAKVQNSVIMILPYGPNWSNSYPKQAFENNLIAIFAQYGVDADRLLIIDPKPVPNREDVREYYQLADVCLDSYPFSGTTSLIEPLQVGLPIISRQGNSFRSAMGAAMIQSLGIADLIADSEESYIQLAVNLGNNLELRQQKSIEVQAKMQDNPGFLDSRAYSAKIGKLFIDLFNKYAKNAQNESLQLRDTNLMVFPDWNQSEESVGYELQQIIQTLATQPNAQNTTLLIDTTNIATEDAQMFLSSIAMNIMMEEDLDISEELGISLIEDLNHIQWENLLPRINSRIVMECDDQKTVNSLLPKQLVQRQIASFVLN